MPENEAAVNEAMLVWAKEQLSARTGVAAKVGACLAGMSDVSEQK